MADDQEVAADLCIIGAGPAGISIAQELDKSGIRICLIESGGLEVERRNQGQGRGESDGYPITRLHHSRIRAFGGSLRHPRLGEEGWAVRPLDPIDFEARAGVRYSGWPFDRVELDPYYDRAQARSCRAKFDYEVSTWSEPHRIPIPLDGTGIETTVFQHDQPRFHEAHEALRSSSNIELLLNSRVVGLIVAPEPRSLRRIRDVLVRRGDGSRLVVRPRMVVLAAGGIENARLLLAADEMRGVGNDHDLVGRFFAERLSAHVGHIVPNHPDLMNATFYERHDVRSTLVCGALRVADKVQHDRGLLNYAFFVLPRPAVVTAESVRSLATLRKAALRRPLIDRRSLYRHSANILRGLAEIGGIARAGRNGGANVLTLRVQGEQAPNRDSRVTLGARRDEYGIPVARVTWQVTNEDRASIWSSIDVVDTALRSRGLGVVERTTDPYPLFEGNNHHMGTTRMHADPKLGVLDSDCRVHAMSNLYVTGSSVFPTYGSSNPTLTIVALALRLADHMREQLTQR